MSALGPQRRHVHAATPIEQATAAVLACGPSALLHTARLLARHGLPRPLTNVAVAGHERDACFPAHRLIVELDGWDFHNDCEQFERDRDHNADALAAGIPVPQITRPRLAATAAREAARLHRILQRQGPRGSAGPTD